MPRDLRDRETFARAYQENHAAVFRFVLGMTGDPAKAAELTQDAFVWLIDHPGSYDPERGRLDAFLIGVARKLLLRRNRVERAWTELPDSAELIAGPEPEPEPDVAALHQAIQALPARYREMVVLCDLEGRSYEEAAAAAECAVGTVRSRLHRARQFLARKLESRRCKV